MPRNWKCFRPRFTCSGSSSRSEISTTIPRLISESARWCSGLEHFSFRGIDVIVFHVLDPDEIDFPFEVATRFEDLETAEEVMAVPGAVRADYLKAIGGLIDRYRRELGASGIDYQLLNTNHPLELALL